MRASDIFPSKYLKAEELDQDYTVTIEEVKLEQLEQNDGAKIDKPVIYFKEFEKGLVCNKTNFTLIAKQHGDDTDEWTGKQITLTVMDVEAFGDIVQAIRIKSVRKAAAPGAKPGIAKHQPAAAQTQPTGAAQPAQPAAGETKSADEVTEFWTEARKLGFDRKQALEVLLQSGNDFTKAKAALGEVPF